MDTAQEIALMKKDIETLSEEVKELNGKMDMLMTKLLDPETGLVVRVNKNTERLDERDENLPGWIGEVEDFRRMKDWKKNINKALWILYSSIIGLIIKLLFWD